MLPRSSIPAVQRRAGCSCTLGCAEAGTARLALRLMLCWSYSAYLRTDFFSYYVAPQPQKKSVVPVETQHSSPSLSEWICPASPGLGCSFLQAVPVWPVPKGREGRVALYLLFTFSSAYLRSDRDVTFFEACEPMSAEESGCFGVVFKSKPYSTRECGIWRMEGLVEICVCRATGSIMQAEWYLHGDKALPGDLTPSNI